MERYLKGDLSVPRNSILAGVFYRLRLSNWFGTGQRQIDEAYEGSRVKPRYEIADNAVRVILPHIALWVM